MMGGRFLPTFLLAPLLAGCATAEVEPVAHGVAVPDAWSSVAPASAAPMRDWWAGFGNEELTGLVAAARGQGYDVEAAEARVRQALASVRIAGAPLLPEIDASAGAERTGAFGDAGSSAYDAALTARYELDLWSRNRASRRAALAALDAAGHDREAVALVAETETASAWLATVAATERRSIATLNLAAANQVLALVESRYRAGTASPLELAQQRGLVAGLEQRLAVIEGDIAVDRAALAALVGRPSPGFEVATAKLSTLLVPAISADLPATVLTRRPDIVAAERRLAAADADVAAARAAMLPQVTLSAGAGYESGRLSRLFDDPLYSLAAGLAAPIFAGDRLRGERDLAIARREELLADYRQAIVTAFAEVDQALASIAAIEREQGAQAEALRQAETAARLANSRYRAGAETLLTMLDAQRTLYAAQEDALTLRQARLEAAVTLYRALGGSMP